MKHAVILALSVLAASTALAQSPSTGTSGGTSASGSSGEAGATKSDDKKAMGASAGAMGAKGMDANHDGMISKQEYDRYNSNMWSKMKPTKGQVSTADMDAMLKGGPN